MKLKAQPLTWRAIFGPVSGCVRQSEEEEERENLLSPSSASDNFKESFHVVLLKESPASQL